MGAQKVVENMNSEKVLCFTKEKVLESKVLKNLENKMQKKRSRVSICLEEFVNKVKFYVQKKKPTKLVCKIMRYKYESMPTCVYEMFSYTY